MGIKALGKGWAGGKIAGHTAVQVVLMLHVLGRPSYDTHNGRNLENI